MAELKASYEKAEQEYKRHKEQISTIAEEADSIKVTFREPELSSCFSSSFHLSLLLH